MHEHLNNAYHYAVVGASNDPNKYGHKVFKHLLQHGHKVTAVNPKKEPILDEPAYGSLGEVPGSVDVAVFVVPPAVTEGLLPEVLRLGIPKVWLQPGSESDTAAEFCKEHQIDAVVGDCIMHVDDKENCDEVKKDVVL